MQKEIEIKFLGIDKEAIRQKLQENGFVRITDEFLMQRKTFHPVSTDKNEWFRVRRESDKITMTYKCIHSNDLSGTEEVEIIVDDFDNAVLMLLKTGLHNTSTQENLREVWKFGKVEVCIDTWPGLDPYIEIEAPTESQVMMVTERLGFDFNDGLFGGTESVYAKVLWIPPAELVKFPEISFRNPPKSNIIR